MSSSKCARCDKTVYPVEGLRCLDKIWHKGCFKCHECSMTLSLKNYKGFEKMPYCNAHCPQAKATTVADTPEIRRLAENTRIQSQAKYHEDFEKSKGKNFTPIADDPVTRRIKETSKIISNVAYHGEIERKKQMEERRGLSVDELSLVRGNSNILMSGQSNNNNNNNVSNNNNNNNVPNRLSQNLSGNVVQANELHQQQHHHHLHHQQNQHQQAQQHYQQQQMQRQQQQQQQQQQQRQQQLLKQQQQQYLAQQQLLMQRQQQQQQQQQQMLMQQQQQLKHQINMPIMTARQPSKQAILAHTNNHPMSPQHHQFNQIRAPILPIINGPPPPSAQGVHMIQMLPNGQRVNHHLPGQVLAPPPNHMVNHPHQQQQQQQQQMPSAGQVRRVFRAMYDYVANDVDEVSFYENDLLVDCVNVDRNWLIGKVARSGQTGMLPANYVTELPSQ